MTGITGTVQSHTVIRAPGSAHADAAPFVLLLVELDNGKRVLGHFAGGAPPAIGTGVTADQTDHTPVFRVVGETHGA